MHARFGKLTGHHSGDGACELMDHDKYILEKLQFLEKHIACMPSRHCSVSINSYMNIHVTKCQYVKLLNAM